MEKQNMTSGFQQVDKSQHDYLIKFLEDVAKLPDVIKSFELRLKQLAIQKGDRVLDVGCGIGLQAQNMAKLVGTEGKVTGTDLSTVMVEISRTRAAGSGLPLEFIVANAMKQPFPDQSFDCIHSERVLMYIKEIESLLQEFKRLLKANGRLAIFDMDWDAMVIPHRDQELTRKIVRYTSESFPNGRIGSKLFRQFRAAGFRDVNVQPMPYAGSSGVMFDITKRIYEGILQTGVSENLFTETEITEWWQAIEEDHQEGNFFISYPGFITCGTK